jgi:AraC-like DNA-binding protein
MHPELATIPPTAPVNDAHENVPWDGSEEMFWEAVNRQDSVLLAQVLADARLLHQQRGKARERRARTWLDQVDTVRPLSRETFNTLDKALRADPSLNVRQLQRMSGVGATVFAVAFKLRAGMTCKAWQVRVRAELAQALLAQHPDWSMTQICHRVGVRDRRSLYRYGVKRIPQER